MSYSISTADRRHQAKSELVRMSRLSLTRGNLAFGAGIVLALIALALTAFFSVSA